jgi:WD40 repeat protein
MIFAFDAYVTAALWTEGQAAFVLGDGKVRWSDGSVTEAHAGAALCAAPHPKGGVLTGGDDGRLVRSTPSGAETVAELPRGRWVEAVAASPASGLAAFASGRSLHVRDLADPKFGREFPHENSVAGLAFEPKGRRLAAATYGGRGSGWRASRTRSRPR